MYNIRQELENKYKDEFVCEMTMRESDYLCNLICENHPKKIVEIGIAEGGTSLMILTLLNRIGYNDTTLYSIDFSEEYYRDNNLKSGYLAVKYAENIPDINWVRMCGNYAPTYIENIGADIDFLILDTVHALPGEVLDFLAFLPYLSENAIVVFHDTSLHLNCNDGEAICNCVAYCAITGEKFSYGLIDEERSFGISNIGALRVNADTRKYIKDVFNTLLLPWKYLPSLHELNIYGRFYEINYDNEMMNMYHKSIWANEMLYIKFKMGLSNEEFERIEEKFKSSTSIWLYGYGKITPHFYNLAKYYNGNINGIAVSNDTYIVKENELNLPMITIDEIEDEIDLDTDIIITCGNRNTRRSIMQMLSGRRSKMYKLGE